VLKRQKIDDDDDDSDYDYGDDEDVDFDTIVAGHTLDLFGPNHPVSKVWLTGSLPNFAKCF